jgi:uncharacterized BrkB/YihY/UPF0761 family membrane protein
MDQAEPLFALVYTLFLISYNYRDIPLHIHRFVIPVVPLLLFSLRDWIPRDRRVLWVAAAISAILSCAPLLYLRNVFGFRLP